MATTSRRRRQRTASSAAKPQRTFSELQTAPQTNSGRTCPRCGENEKAGNVGVRLNKREGGQTKQVTSRHIAMCESCCIEVYEELAGRLQDSANGME